MSSSPRSRTSQTAIFALAVGAAIIGADRSSCSYYGVNVLEAGSEFVDRPLPADRGHDQGAEIRNLYTVVFLIAVAIFLVVEGLIIWTVIRYRRKPGDDTLPPQTHGNNIAEFVWTIVPTIIVIFMFVVSWQTLNEVDTSSADAADQDPRRRRPVPVAVRLPRPGRHDGPLHGVHPAGRARAAG